jgi:hypothetical protein
VHSIALEHTFPVLMGASAVERTIYVRSSADASELAKSCEI